MVWEITICDITSTYNGSKFRKPIILFLNRNEEMGWFIVKVVNKGFVQVTIVVLDVGAKFVIAKTTGEFSSIVEPAGTVITSCPTPVPPGV